jgi:xylose dehydrogenase (NAD/NADP)
MPAKLRWGILGTGNIATQFSVGLKTSERGILAAVGSRRRESAEAFGKTHQIARAFDTYDALVSDPSIDAIYNALPNSLHESWTIRALDAGKHVLCEKPIANTASEAERMFDAAKKNQRLLAEAFMYRSHPQTLAVMEAIKSGAIGELRLIRTSFCYCTRKIEGNVRFVRQLGGGALMDIGCYCINFARYFAENEPGKISVLARFHSSGVDELTTATMEFPGGILSTFACAMCTHADNTAFLCGTEGFIEIPVPWKPMPGSTFTITRGQEPKMDRPKSETPPPRDVRKTESPANMYGIEADDFAAAALDGNNPRITREDTLGNMRVLDEMRGQIGLHF